MYEKNGISGFRRDVNEIFALLGCYAAVGGSYGLTRTACRSHLHFLEGGTDRLFRNLVATNLRCVAALQNEDPKNRIVCGKLKTIIFRSVKCVNM